MPLSIPHQIACKSCSNAFEKRTHNAIFCSEKCKVSWSKTFGTRLHMQVEYNRTKREKYAKNESLRKKIIDKVRKYREQYPDRVKASDEKYRKKHRDKAVERSRKWHAENKARANTRRIVRKQVQRTDRPWNIAVSSARTRARESDIPFDLTDEWGAARWTGKCELTGIPFRIVRGVGTKIFAPSLDRIIPSLGYVQSNCRFILFCVNAFKHNGTDEQMYAVADALMKARHLRDSESIDIIQKPAA